MRKHVASEITRSTTVKQTTVLIKQRSVTHVTLPIPVSQVDVKELTVYDLLVSHDYVTREEFLEAVVKDLKLLRGGE